MARTGLAESETLRIMQESLKRAELTADRARADRIPGSHGWHLHGLGGSSQRTHRRCRREHPARRDLSQGNHAKRRSSRWT